MQNSPFCALGDVPRSKQREEPMAGYRTHLTWSAAAGVGLGFCARHIYGVSLPQSVLGGVLCALGGVLPDVDSDNSTAYQRCMGTIAGSFAIILASRLGDFIREPEAVITVSALFYFFIFYGIGSIVKRLTAHRGMCHSIPFGIIAGEIIFILSSGDTGLRLFKSGAIFLGVLVHLTLDEIYSLEVGGKSGRQKRSLVRVKNSFGTGLKLIDYKHMKSTICFYVAVVMLGQCAMNVQQVLAQIGDEGQEQIRGKAAIDHVRTAYPTQYDLSVVQWIAENGLILSPGQEDNRKWQELQNLLTIGKKDDKESASQGTTQTTKGESDFETNAEDVQVSLLDVVNWNNLKKDRSNENLEIEESPRRTQDDGKPRGSFLERF